jgi:hypothetical protein
MSPRRKRQVSFVAGMAFLLSLGLSEAPAGASVTPPPTVLGTSVTREQAQDQVPTPCVSPLCEKNAPPGNGTKAAVDGQFFCQPKGFQLTYSLGAKATQATTFTAVLTSLVDQNWVRRDGPFTLRPGHSVVGKLFADVPFGSVAVRSLSTSVAFYSTGTGVREDIVPCDCAQNAPVPTTTPSPVTPPPLSPSTPGAPPMPAASAPGAPTTSATALTNARGETILPETGPGLLSLLLLIALAFFVLGAFALRGSKAPDLDVEDIDTPGRWFK